MSVRVVAGTARGRRLAVPAGQATRPTSDRVREAVFNALASLDAIDGADVLDPFAGSGALAIEALSRGAARATLIESDRSARAIIEANLASCGLAEQASVVAGDALAHLARTADQYDLVLLDPPYRYAGWADLQRAVLAQLAPDGVIVIESDQPVEVVPPLSVVREKRYGGTVVLFTRKSSGTAVHAGAHE